MDTFENAETAETIETVETVENAAKRQNRRHGSGCVSMIRKTYWGRINIDGTTYRRNTGLTSKREALRLWNDVLLPEIRLEADKARKARGQGKAGTRATFGHTPLAGFFTDGDTRGGKFYARVALQRSMTERLWKEYRTHWREFCRFALTQKVETMEQLAGKPGVAVDFFGEFLATKPGMSYSTMGKYRQHLDVVFREMNDHKLPNPFERVQIQGEASYSHGNLTYSEVEALIAAAAQRGDEWRDLFLLASRTGLRLKDCVNFDLQSYHGDEESGIIRVRPSKTDTKARNDRKGQRGKMLCIPVHGRLALVLWQRLIAQGGMVAVAAKAGAHTADTTPIYAFPGIRAMSNPNQALHDIFATVGIDTSETYEDPADGTLYRKSFHSFRTYVACTLGRAGMPIQAAAEILGHSVEVYAKYYLKRDEGMLVDWMRRAMPE